MPNRRVVGNIHACVMLAVLGASIVSPARAAIEDLGKVLGPLCSQLQKDGWVGPSDPRDSGRRSAPEMEIAGVIYLCTLERPMARSGAGRSPDLGALLSNSQRDPSIIFSANVWCEGDRSTALDQLSDQVERGLRAVSIVLPNEVLKAIRHGEQRNLTAGRLNFSTTPIDVDPNACAHSNDTRLSPVLMKLDVSIQMSDGQ